MGCCVSLDAALNPIHNLGSQLRVNVSQAPNPNSRPHGVSPINIYVVCRKGFGLFCQFVAVPVSDALLLCGRKAKPEDLWPRPEARGEGEGVASSWLDPASGPARHKPPFPPPPRRSLIRSMIETLPPSQQSRDEDRSLIPLLVVAHLVQATRALGSPNG